MMSREISAAASRYGVSVTLPELERDIDAQLAALADPEHPKTCVFLARSNSLGERKLPSCLFVERRAEGTLITTSATMAHEFRSTEHITDGHIAAMLGYPEAKADIMMCDDITVVQALDQYGCVIWECGVSPSHLNEATTEAIRQQPVGGNVVRISIYDAIMRRQQEMN